MLPTVNEKHRDIALCIDVFYGNKVPFLITVGDPVEYIPVQVMQNETDGKLKKYVWSIMKLYTNRGLKIRRVDREYKFNSLRDNFIGIINICSHDEHVTIIKRKIRVVRERCWADSAGLPFHKIPKIITIYLV